MAKTYKKYFTPNEANKRLPYVRKIVQEILEKGRVWQKQTDEQGENNPSPETLGLQVDIETLMSELEDLGCFFKDWNFEIGLVDFPSKINGQVVLMCWRNDEDSVRWFHPVETGYVARQPIPEELLRGLK